ncbi:hypothetical protein ACEPAI_6401 [Sanghuangporus weigelae]
MSIFGHDYRSHGARKRVFLSAVGVVVGLLVVVDILVLKGIRPPPSLLDQYRPFPPSGHVHEEHLASDTNLSSFYSIPSPNERAVVTTLFSESYSSAAVILGHSLGTSQISARRMLLYFPERISPRTVCWLREVGWELHPIERIAPPDGGRGVFHRFVDNYSKLQIWTLDKIGIKSVVYLDADILVRSNFNELWSLPFEFAAVPDVYRDKRGFASTFNAGMMFLRTSSAVFADMLSKIESDGYRHNEAEQGLLNMYFAAQVVLLPYIYNANLMIKQRNPVLWQAIKNDTRILHYTLLKPFIEEERQQATSGIWEPEMRLWELAWMDAFNSDLQDKC